MFHPVQLDRQDRKFLSAVFLFIDHKVKSSVIEQAVMRQILLKHLGDGHFFSHLASSAIVQDVIECVVQAHKKRLFCLRTVRLDAQCPRIHFIGSHLVLPFLPDILRQLVHIISFRVLMEPLQILHAGNEHQLLYGPGSGHVDQFPVILEPVVSLIRSLIRQRG